MAMLNNQRVRYIKTMVMNGGFPPRTWWSSYIKIWLLKLLKLTPRRMKNMDFKPRNELHIFCRWHTWPNHKWWVQECTWKVFRQRKEAHQQNSAIFSRTRLIIDRPKARKHRRTWRLGVFNENFMKAPLLVIGFKDLRVSYGFLHTWDEDLLNSTYYVHIIFLG